MAVSAECVNVFAAEDDWFADIPLSNGEVVTVYERDLVDDAYTVRDGDVTITVGKEKKSNIALFSSGTNFSTSFPSDVWKIGDDGSHNARFDVPKASGTYYSPKLYYPGTGNDSIKYSFQADAKYDSSVKAAVHIDGQSDMPIALSDTSKHYISASGLSSNVRTYAYVTNSAYSGTASGTCVVTN